MTEAAPHLHVVPEEALAEDHAEGRLEPAPEEAGAWSLTGSLGIAGCGALDHALLAALSSGDPVLLVGAPGSAKTTLARRLAGALSLVFHAYDASKALFEDVVGFPDPTSLSEGERVRYVPTPLSLVGKQFVLVDEISRATPGMQNKWLEVVRARTLMGEAVPSLRYVHAAMNPPSCLGAHPLDEALAGRFAFVLEVPGVERMDSDDLRHVINHVGEEDAPLLGETGAPRPSTGQLEERLVAIRERTRAIEHDEEIAAALTSYVEEVFHRLRKHGVVLDGRRLRMLRSNLALFLAVEFELEVELQADPLDVVDHGPLLVRCLRQSLPGLATGAPVAEAAVLEAHRCALDRLRGRVVPHLVDFSGDPVKWMASFLAAPEPYGDSSRRELTTTLLERVETTEGARPAARAAVALCQLARAVMAGEVRLHRDDASRVLVAFSRSTELARPASGAVLEMLQEVRNFGSAEPDQVGEMDLAFRIATMIATRSSQHPRRPGGRPSFADNSQEFRDALDEARSLLVAPAAGARSEA